MLVLWIFGVDTHCRVAHDGLRTCCGYDCISVLADNFVAEIIELAVFFLVDNFDVAECGLRFRIPVDHALASVDETFAVEIDEHADHASGADVVHGEGGAFPVA